MAYRPIVAVRTLSGTGFPAQDRWGEKAHLTMPQGVPLMLSGGYVLEADFSGGASVVAGVSVEPAHNLDTDATAKYSSEGTPPNQSSAVITPVGAWIKDGTMGFYLADGRNVFLISLKSGQTFDATKNGGGPYSLTKDGTTGFWYLDYTATGANASVAIPVDGVSDDNTLVLFQFKSTQRTFA